MVASSTCGTKESVVLKSSVLNNKGLGINAKKCLYEGVIGTTALCGAEAWSMRGAERRNVNVLEMKCFRSLVRVSQMDRVRNKEVRKERVKKGSC